MPFFYYVDAEEILSRLAAIERGVGKLVSAVKHEEARDMSAQEDINRLKRIVEENTSTTNSAITMIQGLSQMVRENADNPEEIRAIADQLDKDVRSLSASIQANVPNQPQQPQQLSGEQQPSGEQGGEDDIDPDTGEKRSSRRRR
jgi:ABC-type transporter Mla subunit MlaD